MAVTIKKSAGVGTTSVQQTKAGVDVGVPLESEEHIETPPVRVTPAVVTLSMGYTKNLGNYESAKVSVAISLPCASDEPTIEQTFKYAEDWVNDKMGSIVSQL